MAGKKKRGTPNKDDMTIGELARMINSAFIKQDERFAQHLEKRLDQNRKDIMAEIDSRGYVTNKDLDNRGYITNKDLEKELDKRNYITRKDLNDRKYVTQHDLQDAVIDAKDEIIEHIDRAVTPRLTRLEQKV